MVSKEKKTHFFMIFKYLFFGGSAFLIDFFVLYFCKSWLEFSAWSSAIIAFVLSTIFAYFTQMRFTFSHKMKNISPLIKYLLLLLCNMGFTALVVQGFDSLWDMYLLGKIFSTACVTLWNFPLMKYFVFPKNISHV